MRRLLHSLLLGGKCDDNNNEIPKNYFRTAYSALIDKVRIQPEQSIFITAASGGVGSFAVQIAKLCGLKTIIASCSPKNFDKVRKLGATHVVDYANDDTVQKAMEFTHGRFICILFFFILMIHFFRGVDVWIDMVSPQSADMGVKSLAFSGHIVIIQNNPTVPLGELFMRQISVHEIFLGGHWKADEANQKHLRTLGTKMIHLVAEKKIEAAVSRKSSN